MRSNKYHSVSNHLMGKFPPALDILNVITLVVQEESTIQTRNLFDTILYNQRLLQQYHHKTFMANHPGLDIVKQSDFYQHLMIYIFTLFFVVRYFY